MRPQIARSKKHTSQNSTLEENSSPVSTTPDRATNSLQTVRHSPHALSQWVNGLQRTIGNRAVQRLLGKQPTPQHADVIQPWREYTVEFGASLADKNKIAIFDDRIDHILERHGPDVQEASSDFYTFTSNKKGVIQSFVRKDLESGTVYRGVGGAFDFEYTFDHPIGKNNEGDTTSRIRVIVVEMGTSGEKGKVQTAYPI